MSLKVTSANQPTTADAIGGFERSRGVSFPSAYKEFLLTSNGGVPEAALFPIEGMALNPNGVVQAFFGIDAEWPTSDLAKVHDLFANGIPAGIVPIAGNGMGDYVCLDLRNGRERIAFWDKRHFWSTGEWRETDLYHIANSFGEFLASLRPNPV